MDIYRVSFGMEYGFSNNPIYKNKLFVEKEGSTIEFYVYGVFLGKAFKELITGEEIPIPKRKTIPGFGAYELTKVYLIEDLQALVYYSNLAIKYLDEYKMSLKSCKDYFNKIGFDYTTTYIDSYGQLSSYSEEREKDLDDSLNDYAIKIGGFINNLRVNDMFWVEHQGNLQLSLFKDID